MKIAPKKGPPKNALLREARRSRCAQAIINSKWKQYPNSGYFMQRCIMSVMSGTLYTRDYVYFRSLLVQAREAAGLTQVALSVKLGRPQSFVSKYENGERRLDVIEFVQVCNALEVNACDVLKKITK